VILYWTGYSTSNATDTEISVNGTPIVGTLIGGPTLFFTNAWSSTVRADITEEALMNGWIGPGSNSLSISGMDFTTSCPSDCQNIGAGLVVIYDDGGVVADIQIKDGNDLAFFNFAPPLDTTVPQTFEFIPAATERVAELCMFTGSVEVRPTVVEVTTEPGPVVTRFVDLFQSTTDPNFEAVCVDVDIPAGATSMTVQALSEKDATSTLSGIPASLNWLAAAAVIPPPLAARVTGGGVDDSGNWDGTFAKGNSNNSDRINMFTCGGQAGANTAVPPQPAGEWTHRQVKGPAGSFTFHGGTHSAPPLTEIDWIQASDPGTCIPARQAPGKQIDFAGVGSFKNVKGSVPNSISQHVTEDVSLHWFEVNIDDLGEPGKGGKVDPPEELCDPDGFGRNSSTALADCDCPDFYRIKIYAGPTDASAVIYEVRGYLRGGNFQIHPLTGFDQ
jgi:hypothetical protein